jgi:acetyl-CoA hydrolase
MQLAQWIRPGDGVIFGQACAEPQTLVEALVAQRTDYSGATLFMGVNWSGTVKPEHADHLRLTAYCGSGHNRKLADAGVLDIHAHPYSQLAGLIRQRKIKADVVLV